MAEDECGIAVPPKAGNAIGMDAAGARKQPQPGRQTAKPSSLTGAAARTR